VQGPQLALTATRLSSCGEEPVGHGLIVVHAAAKGAPLAGAAPTVSHKPRSCDSSPSASPRAALLPKECADSSHPATHPCIQQQQCCGGAPGSKQQEGAAAAGSAGEVRWGAGQYSSWREWWCAMQEPKQLATNLRVLGLAAVAGTSAGVMAGMTGEGRGPGPRAVLAGCLHVGKVVLGCFQPPTTEQRKVAHTHHAHAHRPQGSPEGSTCPSGCVMQPLWL
jgi:hypothetical protein